MGLSLSGGRDAKSRRGRGREGLSRFLWQEATKMGLSLSGDSGCGCELTAPD